MVHRGGAGSTSPGGKAGNPVLAGAHREGVAAGRFWAHSEAAEQTITNNIRDIMTIPFFNRLIVL